MAGVAADSCRAAPRSPSSISGWPSGPASTIVELHATGPAAVFWANVAYFGIVLVPASWLVFALRYSGHGRPGHQAIPGSALRRAPGDGVPRLDEPLASLVSRERAGGADLGAGPRVLGPRRVLLRPGPRRNGGDSAPGEAGPRPERGQAATLLIAAFAPWMANAIYLSGLSPFGNLDLSPFGFGLTSLAVGVGALPRPGTATGGGREALSRGHRPCDRRDRGHRPGDGALPGREREGVRRPGLHAARST